MAFTTTNVCPVIHHVKLLKTRRLQPTKSKLSFKSLSTSQGSVNMSMGHEQQRNIGVKDYFDQARDLMMKSKGGPPRWFSPLECGSRLNNSPLLLYLPGIDGTGVGLILHHQRLAEFFNIWCLHIPLTDRTPFSELVKLVERTVRSEHHQSPKRPIYIVGESFGACLALSVAAFNPDIDLILILANPATCFSKSWISSLMPLLQIIPQHLPLNLPLLSNLMADIASRMAMPTVGKGLPLQQTVEDLSMNFAAFSSYISGLGDGLTVETLLWKLKIIESASSYANSRLDDVKAQSLILISCNDQFLPSQEEGERLCSILPNCEIRTFNYSSHFLLLERSHDLVTIVKEANYYRRGRHFNYVSDFIPPSPSEIEKHLGPFRWLNAAVSPVMLTTLENGEIVRSLEGIPSEGPVIFVGYHMLLGIDSVPLFLNILDERNILVRGLSHPALFREFVQSKFPTPPVLDTFRIVGSVPVSPTNFFRLLSSNSHVLLYPGGAREAAHRKGEEYKLFWPKRAEFVRIAARFGAKIVPFGVVGEDDITQLIIDYNDQMKIPFMKEVMDGLTAEIIKLRVDDEGEVGNQDWHFTIVLPKLPGRFYYYFGKPIETAGRRDELKDKEKANELYMEVKSEVEKCLCYLKEKREKDPYRSILARAFYQATHGLDSQIPTFDL